MQRSLEQRVADLEAKEAQQSSNKIAVSSEARRPLAEQVLPSF